MSSLLYNLIFLVGLITVTRWVIVWGLYLWGYLWEHENRWVILCWAIFNLIIFDIFFVFLLWIVLSILRPEMDATKLSHLLSITFIFIIGAAVITWAVVFWENHRFWKRQK